MKNINRLGFFAIVFVLVFGIIFSTLSVSAQTQTSDASVNVKVDSSLRPTFWKNLKDRWFTNSSIKSIQAPDNVSIPTTGDTLSYPKTEGVKYDAGMTDSPKYNTETQTGIIGRWNLDYILIQAVGGTDTQSRPEKIAMSGTVLSLSNTGKFELVGTCNYISGTWQRPQDDAGDRIAFFNVTATEKPCVICQSTQCTEAKARLDKYLRVFGGVKTIIVTDWTKPTSMTFVVENVTNNKERVSFVFSRSSSITPIDGGTKPTPPIKTPIKEPIKDFTDNAIESRFNQTFRQLSETHKKISGLVDRVEAQAKKMAANGTNITAETQYIAMARANLKRAETAIADAQTSFKLELQTYRDTKPEKLEGNSSINSSENSKKYFAKTLANIATAKNSLKTAKDGVDQTWSLLKAKLIEEQEARGGNDDTSDDTDQATDSSL